jgi:hypothetical protein
MTTGSSNAVDVRGGALGSDGGHCWRDVNGVQLVETLSQQR